MTTYDYKCTNCDNIQEEIHSITLDPEIKCNECKSLCKKMMPNDVQFILKGSGWSSKEMRLKKDMTKKNTRMKGVMKDRKTSGEGVSSVEDLKKVKSI